MTPQIMSPQWLKQLWIAERDEFEGVSWTWSVKQDNDDQTRGDKWGHAQADLPHRHDGVSADCQEDRT